MEREDQSFNTLSRKSHRSIHNFKIIELHSIANEWIEMRSAFL